MSKTKMEWSIYNSDENKSVKTISKESYKEKYKGKLTCIHGCEAKIKFTEKKNGNKFYSTWNKEGNKHKEDCEFHVNYKGKAGRKRLIAEENKKEITDDQIKNAITRNFRELKKYYNGINNGEEAQSTNHVKKLGDKVVGVLSDGEDYKGNITGRTNVTSIEADLINSTYDKIRKCVIGVGKNVQYFDGDEPSGYINLKSENYNVATYFPPAFFYDNKFTESDFKKVRDIINHEINNNKEVIIICFGRIYHKKGKKNDYNINIISPNHIKINEMAMNDILVKGSVKELNRL